VCNALPGRIKIGDVAMCENPFDFGGMGEMCGRYGARQDEVLADFEVQLGQLYERWGRYDAGRRVEDLRDELGWLRGGWEEYRALRRGEV